MSGAEISAGKRSIRAHGPFPKFAARCKCSTMGSILKHLNEETGNTHKASPQHWVSKVQLFESNKKKKKKPQDSQSVNRTCAIQHTQMWILFSRDFLLPKISVSLSECENPFKEACFQFARNAAVSSLPSLELKMWLPKQWHLELCYFLLLNQTCSARSSTLNLSRL